MVGSGYQGIPGTDTRGHGFDLRVVVSPSAFVTTAHGLRESEAELALASQIPK